MGDDGGFYCATRGNDTQWERAHYCLDFASPSSEASQGRVGDQRGWAGTT